MAEDRYEQLGDGSGSKWNPALVAGLVAGGALIAGYSWARRGGSGDNQRGGVGESEQLSSGEYHYVRTQTIDRPASELWAFWREEENAPRFMKYIVNVQHTGGKQSHWVMQVPGGPRIEWDSEVYDERPGKAFSWRTVRGDWQQQGRVLLRPAPGNRGTEVRLEMWYEVPGGKLGKALASVVGRDAQQLGIENLHRFKQLMEAGEIITVENQSHGKRSGKGNLMQLFLREPEAEQKASGVQAFARGRFGSGWSDAVDNVQSKVKEFTKGASAEKLAGVAAVAADVAKGWQKKGAQSVTDAAKSWQKSDARDSANDLIDEAKHRWKQAGKSVGRGDLGKAWNRATKAR